MTWGGQHTGDLFEAMPENHEVFEALCALSLTAELSAGDEQRLASHLEQCVACRHLLEDFEQLSLEVLPHVGAALQDEQSNSGPLEYMDPVAEARLLAAIEVSSANKLVPFERRELLVPRWKKIGSLAAILILGLGAGAGLMRNYLVRRTHVDVPAYATVHIEKVSDKRTEDKLLEVRESLVAAQARNRQLQVKILAASKELDLQRKGDELLQRQLEEDRGRLDALSQEKLELTGQLAAATEEAQQLRVANAQQTEEASVRLARVVEVENRMRELHAALDQKDRALQEDRELLAHDRDIRDLIGARNVYMAEVYDVAETGKTNKPFGRVFYTRDKSLIFYGYDLDQQPNLKRSVVFQGWGASSEGKNINLGLFYQDDNKRWILKFRDAKILARLNSVFITVEPRGGSDKPTGKPLLSAYLRLDPNHP